MLSSEGVVTAFLEMLERDYRGALRTMFSSTNAQMSEDELRERIRSQISYCPQDAAVARVRAWAADDPREGRGGPPWSPADLLLGRSRRDLAAAPGGTTGDHGSRHA